MADLDAIEEERRRAEEEAAKSAAATNFANIQNAWKPSGARELLDKTNASLDQMGKQSGVDQLVPPADKPFYIPNSVRAVDYVQRGLPTGPMQGDPQPVGLDNPQTGNFINQTGQNLGPTNVNGRYQGNPPGAAGIQGQLSPQEQAFWAANPNGAIKDPSTGNLIGLGAAAPAPPPVDENGMVAVNSGLGPPAVPYNQQTRINEGLGPVAQKFPEQRVIPDFIQIPEVNPAVIAQRRQIQNEIAITRDQLRSASSQRFRGQPSQREILSQRLGTLTDANNSLGLEHYRQAEEQRKATDQNRKLQDQYVTHQDVMDATKAIAQIQAPHGSEEFKKQYFQITDQYPNALKDPAFKSEVIKTAQFHDERAAARERAIAAGLIVKETGYGQKGPTEKYIDPNAVPDKVKTRYDKVQAEIGKHLEASDIEKTTINKNKAEVPYSKAPDLHAFQSEAASLESQYPGLKPETTATKELDADTAKALVQEAGGDRSKARELARQRGYKF